MKQVIVRTLCDRKNVHPETAEDGFEVPLFNSKGKPVKVDMCEPCEKGITLVEARELADAIGEPIDLPKGRASTPAPGPCPECSEEFTTAQGLGLHRNKVHGVKGKGRS